MSVSARQRLDRQQLAALCGHAVVVGAIVGAAVLSLTLLVQLLTRVVAPSSATAGATIVIVPCLGLALAGALALLGKRQSPVGYAAIGEQQMDTETAVRSPLATAVAGVFGVPIGLDGAAIHAGGAIGAACGGRSQLSTGARRILVASGVAAALSALFGTPLAATILALTLVVSENRLGRSLPVAVAAIVGAALHWMIIGTTVVPVVTIAGDARGVIGSAILGGLAGLVAVTIGRLTNLADDLLKRLPLTAAWRPTVVGLVIGLIALTDTSILGADLGIVAPYLNGSPATTTAIVGRIIAIALLLAVGGPSVGLSALLVLGATLGNVLAGTADVVLPGAFGTGGCALIVMVALAAGATRAPLALTVLALELSGAPLAIVPIFVGCVVATFVSCHWFHRPLLGTNTEADGPLGSWTVGQAMTVNVPVVTSTLTLPRLVERFSDGQHSAFFVIDDAGRLVGLVTAADLPPESQRGELVWLVTADLMNGSTLVVAHADEPLQTALERMMAASVAQLAVVDANTGDRPIGVLTRADVLRALAPGAERSVDNRPSTESYPRRAA
jgi:H+/Cl- antiporter ClcA/predicted transcriptional regulator